MGYQFVKDHTAVNYTHGNSGRKYIVMHYTGNVTDTAAGNANYFRNVNRDASAHYFVDEESVYEVVDPEDTAWAVGVDYGGRLFGACTNGNSISVEMCSVNAAITRKTMENAALLVKSLMDRYGIDEEHVVRHYDVCAKRCPGWQGWVPGDESAWQSFRAMLAGKSPAVEERAYGEGGDRMQFLYTVDGKGPVVWFDGEERHPLSHPDEVKIIQQIYKDNFGHDIPCYSWSSKAPWHVRFFDAQGRAVKSK